MRASPSRLLVIFLAVLGLAAQAQASAIAPVPTDMSQGDPNARVTVIEYASVGCPVCGQWFKTVYPQFKAKYIDTGKVHFITREMLVGGQSEVSIAAAGFLLARCAGKRNYYKVTDAIYASQPDVYDHPKETLLKIAKSVGLTEVQFNACITNKLALKALDDRVRSYVDDDHVESTPTFVINGVALTPGYHPLEELDDAINVSESGK